MTDLARAPHLDPGGAVPAALLEVVRERLARDAAPLSPQVVARALREGGHPVGDATVLAVHDALQRDVVGAGPLEPLLRLSGVTDVLVNGPDAVYVDRGRGLELSAVRFPDDQAVRRLAQRLAATAGRRLDDASPHVDLRLPDGSRFHAVLSPLARPGTSLSLRVPRAEVFALEELVEVGAVPAEGAELLRQVVRRRLAFLVSGGTGSGKTTLLNALLSVVDPGERLVTVEDAAELRPAHPHVVALEARPPNIEGAGEVTLRTLVRQALRMRPDRLVVGEVRSPARVSWATGGTPPSGRDTAAAGESGRDTSLAARLAGTLPGARGPNGHAGRARPGPRVRRPLVHGPFCVYGRWPQPGHGRTGPRPVCPLSGGVSGALDRTREQVVRGCRHHGQAADLGTTRSSA